MIVSAMYSLSYFLIVCASIGLRWEVKEPLKSALVRMILLAINLIVLLLCLCTLEIKSVMIEGLASYKTFFKQTNIVLFIFSVVCLL